MIKAAADDNSQGKLSQLRERLRLVPQMPGVYLFKNLNGEVIYAGKARILRNRLRSYFQAPEKLDPKVRAMMSRVTDFDYVVTSGEVEALVLESNLIKSYHPHYNILLRDDKSYPYIKVTLQEEYPRILMTREKHRDKSRYFGPYTDAAAIREILQILRDIFLLRTCKDFRVGKRPCLNRDLGLCLAPCTGAVDREAYGAQIDQIVTFLEGNFGELVRRIENDMQQASQDLEFERAARLRDTLEAIRLMSEGQKVVSLSPLNVDLMAVAGTERQRLMTVFGIRGGKVVKKESYRLQAMLAQGEGEVLSYFMRQYYQDNPDIPSEILVGAQIEDEGLLELWLREKRRAAVAIKMPQRGEKKKLFEMVRENAVLLWEEELRREDSHRKILMELGRLLDLEVIPARIECFDISHLGGEGTVGSMVVFQDGQRESKSYRRFKLEEKNNDFEAMANVLRRRLQAGMDGQKSFLPLPDLIMVDGGLGQVNVAAGVLGELDIDIPVIGLAKKHEEIFRPGVGQGIRWPRSSEVLRLLQRIRDEAHRFAIEHNRQRIRKRSLVSVLDHIPGIGERRRQELLQAMGSIDNIKRASLDELAGVAGMNRAAAQAVYDFFHSEN